MFRLSYLIHLLYSYRANILIATMKSSIVRKKKVQYIYKNDKCLY